MELHYQHDNPSGDKIYGREIVLTNGFQKEEFYENGYKSFGRR